MIGTYENLKRWQFYVLLMLFAMLGLTPNPGEMLSQSNDLVLHFLGYAIAGISMGLSSPSLKHWQRFAFLVIYSLLIEIGQHFVPHRAFDLFDLLANGLGVLTGLIFYHWLVRPMDRAIENLLHPVEQIK